MQKRVIGPAAAAMLLCYWPVLSLADYTVILKNGRRITVQSYSEKGSTVQIYGLGGELGIPKDQIETILKVDETDRPGLNKSEVENIGGEQESPLKNRPPVRPSESMETTDHGDAKEQPSADEENEYQNKLAEINRQLEGARQRYFSATQGGGAASRATKEGYRALTADLMSRLKERRGAADSEYEPQEKELRDLRMEIERLERERNDLVNRRK